MSEFSRHHIIAKSQGWSDDFKNISLIKDSRHRAIHTLFGDRLPADQIAYLTFGINNTALTDEFKDRVRRLLDMGRGAYQKGVFTLDK